MEEMIKDNLAYKRWDMIIYHIISSIKKYIFHIFLQIDGEGLFV